MMKKIILIIIVLGISFNTRAQNITQEAAREIASNNLSVKAMILENQMKMNEDKQKLIPDDPEFGGAYSWGSPSFIGNKTNLRAHQKIKFPSYYARQKRINTLSADLYEKEMETEMNHVLYESLEIIIHIAYLSEKRAVLEERLTRLMQIQEMASRMFEEGETNRIELEKASLMVDTYQQDMLMLKSEEIILHRQLAGLNAGQTLDIQTPKYEDFEKMYARRKAVDALVDNPVAESAAINKQLAEAGVGLAKTSYLPDLQFGYVREAIRDEKLSGMEFGISIPIWGKSNKVKKARLNKDWSDNHETLTHLIVRNDWDNLNEMARQSYEIKGNLETSLNSLKSLELLEKSWQLGEISLLDYLKELPFYYGVEDRVLEAEKQYYKALLSRNRNHLMGIVIGQ